MKKFYTLLLLALIMNLGVACSSDDDSGAENPPVVEEPKTNAEKIEAAEWEERKVSDEITYKYAYFTDLFSSNQSVTVFEMDLTSDNLSFAIPHVSSGFIKTSDAGWSVGAIAAINGSYFDTTNGGSTTFLKKDGDVITQTRGGFTWYRENAGFGLDQDGNPVIIQKPSAGWASSSYPTLLASGPMLVMNGEEIEQVDQAFTQNRHPRTAIGLTDDNRLLAVVVDGRFSEAHGMSTPELAELMAVLGCTVAMNLDGGGSSTAWLKTRGVVNYPSDNGKFDNEGERGVATAIGFIVEE